MTEIFTKILSEFGVIATLFVAIVLGSMKYIPKLFNEHFKSLRELTEKDNVAREKSQKDFSDSLENITDKNKIVTQGLLKQFEKQGEEHERISESLKEATAVLTEINKKQIEMHADIKEYKEKKS